MSDVIKDDGHVSPHDYTLKDGMDWKAIAYLAVSDVVMARKRIQALESALKPFADDAAELAEGITDDTLLAYDGFPNLGHADFTVGDLRNAQSRIRGQVNDIDMSLRDWFAGQALSQAVEDYGQPKTGDTSGQRKDRGNPVLPYATREMSREEIIAFQAYRYADAMLAARQQVKP